MTAFKVSTSFTVYMEGTIYADSKPDVQEMLAKRNNLLEYLSTGEVKSAYDDLTIEGDDSYDCDLDWDIEYDEVADTH